MTTQQCNTQWTWVYVCLSHFQQHSRFNSNLYPVKLVEAVTSIKQSSVLKRHLFLALSLKVSYELKYLINSAERYYNQPNCLFRAIQGTIIKGRTNLIFDMEYYFHLELCPLICKKNTNFSGLFKKNLVPLEQNI